MMNVWAHRPKILHLGLFIAAYVLAAGYAHWLAIVPGTGISIWPPGGLFMATLILASRPTWPWWVVAGLLAELIANQFWFYSPLPAAVLMYAGNALTAALGACLINRVCRPPVRLETLREVLALVVLGAGIAPIVSATVGSATLAWFGIQSQSFTTAWPLWWIGDATGILTVAPLALVAFQNWRGEAQLSAARWMEAGVLGLIFLGVAALSLSSYLSFAYIIMPALLWVAVRFEFKGAVVTLALLALIAAVFTMTGASQFVGDPESQRQKQIMLQLFLAVSAISALIVAAISRQHQLALLTLRESVKALRDREQDLSRLVDVVPVAISLSTAEGEPTFFNKRLADFLGLDVADMDKSDLSRLAAAFSTVIHPDDVAGVSETYNHCLVTGDRFSMKYRLRRQDGVYRWVEGRAEPLHDQDGAIVQWYAVTLDIDEEVRAQQALRESEQRLRLLVDALPTQIWAATAEGEPSYINRRLAEYVGLTLSDLDVPDSSRLQMAIQSSVHPDDAVSVGGALLHSFTSGDAFAMKYRQRRADGLYRWISGRAEPLRDSDGRIVQWYGVSFDIDDEVKAQESLRARDRELAQLVDMVPSLLWRLTPDGTPTFFNKRMVEFLGLDVADTDKPGMSRLTTLMAETVHPDDVAELGDVLNRCLVTGDNFSMRYRLRRADGVYRWMSSRAEPMRDQDGCIVQWYGLCHDIDDQVLAEAALQRSEQELQQLVDALPIHIWSWTPTGKLSYINKRSLEDLGLSEVKLEDCTKVAQELVHPEDAAEVLRTSISCLETGDPFLMRYRRRWKDGNYRWIEGRCDPLRDRDGTIVHWYQVSIDVEDEMRAQEALRQSERSLRQLVETLPAMLDCAGPDGEPVFRNRQFREYLGYGLEELDGTGKSRLDGTLEAGVHPDDVAAVKQQYTHSLRTGQPFARRHRLLRFDGEYRWVESRASPMRDSDGAIVQWNVVCMDVDGEVRAQEKLRISQETLARSNQAASLAELSASIAHEVNQPLAAIVANSHACQRWLKGEPPNLERARITVERIIRDANSAADVVSRIRALFKQSVAARSYTAFDSVVTEARNLMAEEAARRRVCMNVDIEGDLPLVAFDRIQIQQVLINLIRNGMDAMDSTAGDRILSMRVLRMGDVAQIGISDCGPRVELPDNIFEPFFTTKEQGMGMGLAICRSIVESHGGRLWAEQNEPHGATFIFTLPVEVKAAP